MTNYEKYKDKIINMLVLGGTCREIAQLRGGNNGCRHHTCSTCVEKQKQWLNEEAKEFDPSELKAGDKIIMRKHENTEFSEFEVVCNRFPYCWLRFRDSENGKYRADDDFLIFYDDLLDKYDVKEVLSE